MKKTYLLSYKPEMFQSLNGGGVTHILELEQIWFWGLFKIKKEAKYTVPDHADYSLYVKNWDNLIHRKIALT